MLFVYFGFKLLKDGIEMKNEGPSDELAEVEEELEKKKGDEQEEVRIKPSLELYVIILYCVYIQDDNEKDLESAESSSEKKKNAAAEALKVSFNFGF